MRFQSFVRCCHGSVIVLHSWLEVQTPAPAPLTTHEQLASSTMYREPSVKLVTTTATLYRLSTTSPSLLSIVYAKPDEPPGCRTTYDNAASVDCTSYMIAEIRVQALLLDGFNDINIFTKLYDSFKDTAKFCSLLSEVVSGVC